MNSSRNIVDISKNLVNYDSWNGVLSFWGVTTFNYQAVNTSRLSGVFLDSMVGVMVVYITGSSELKTIIAVLGSSFVNSPTSCGESQKRLKFPSGGQNSWSLAVLYCLRPLRFNLKGENPMTIENTKSSNRKAIIVFNQPYHQVSSEKEQEIISSCREQHRFDVVKTIYCQNKYEAKTYKEMIDGITTQDKPAVIIDTQTYIFPQSATSSAVLGALEHMQLAEIYTYSTSYDRISGKIDEKLTIQKKDSNLITDSIYQLRIAFKSSDKDNEWGK